MDSAVIKDVWNGQFGTLSFKDADNKVVVVAVRVQAKENDEMYAKLIEKAMEVPALRRILNNEKTTCFTDKHKGSESALRETCPLTEHRRCVERMLMILATLGLVSAVAPRRDLIAWLGRRSGSSSSAIRCWLWCVHPMYLVFACVQSPLLSSSLAKMQCMSAKRQITLLT